MGNGKEIVLVIGKTGKRGNKRREMPSSLRLPFPTSASITRRPPPTRGQTRTNLNPPISSSLESDGPDRLNDPSRNRPPKLPCTLLLERYDNGTTKRYILDDGSRIQIVMEEHGSVMNGLQEEKPDEELSWLPNIVKNFILPAGFPGSVSDDYLDYMLLQFPTNVTAWVCHALVTSSLLKAVGVGSFSGTTAAASAAAIRWVSKDGLGAIGRLFIGLAIINEALKGEKSYAVHVFQLRTVAIFSRWTLWKPF